MFSRCRLPILTTVPRSGTWFLRFTISFLCHLERGGRIDDRLTGRVVGDPAGQAFDFSGFHGGPLFDTRGVLSDKRLFIGHTACPGFRGEGFPWWNETRFHVRGYDYFGEGHNYRYTPVELSDDHFSEIAIRALESTAQRGRSGPMALVFRNPVDQAASYYRYCQAHRDPAYRTIAGQPLASLPFDTYLRDFALPSFAKLFASYEAQARRHPGQVLFIPYEHMLQAPESRLTTLLNHLNGRPSAWPWLPDAIALARRDHLRAIELELGRSLDGTRGDQSSHITRPSSGLAEEPVDHGLHQVALARLAAWNIDTSRLEIPGQTPAAAVA